MPHRSILKVTKFQLPHLKRLGTVVKNIFGGKHAPPPRQIGLRQSYPTQSNYVCTLAAIFLRSKLYTMPRAIVSRIYRRPARKDQLQLTPDFCRCFYPEYVTLKSAMATENCGTAIGRQILLNVQSFASRKD